MNKESFLKVAQEFSLGKLTTEGFNPITKDLSSLSINDLELAIEKLKEVDLIALGIIQNKVKQIFELHQNFMKTLKQGNRIFLCGCGATGRLSVSLEFLWRKKYNNNKVISFMAGGDYALIKSVESFEDRMSFGSRQLKELGFQNGDLLIAITEGGETSFVIGAALEASNISKNNPYFVYCNPDNELIEIERSKNVLRNEKIKKLNLTIGPMALSGSTRMQATTVQMLAVGIALLTNDSSWTSFQEIFNKELELLKKIDYKITKDFINWEHKIYNENGHITYLCDPDLAIAILTDTTERSPTFSLKPFEKINEFEIGLCYLAIKGTTNSKKAWNLLLGHEPRGLNWPELEVKIDTDEIFKFDISENAILRREGISKNHHIFEIIYTKDKLVLKNNFKEEQLDLSDSNLFISHLATKLIMNTLSTLIMGKLGRYEANMMTWVRASNYKLIDRAARYVQELGNLQGVELVYDEIIHEIFEYINIGNKTTPIVISVLNKLITNRKD